eukprot:4588393-Amphidinium_carterae.1
MGLWQNAETLHFRKGQSIYLDFTTPGSKKLPIKTRRPLNKQHSQYRKTIGQLLWVSQLRAGCNTTKKVQVEITMCWGGPLMHSNRTQSTIVLSSAEAELYAMGQATIESQHIKQVIDEMAIPEMDINNVTMMINTDSSSGKAVASRLGLNR